ncbi:aldehyde reductase [Amycolatopsis endophytica]|uniref:Nucleoside-diphosphate-sugar epimerase n=1 Tax=Amycolatopsis endophytica TaxID=860233 RepID=A0A853BC75_9PSEU|nr:aldehyde reductase [Amycolatopsis endophytica]NYI92352.1 nucleoside-diphosphate-sugar epimerase [Amycolatopsis endophytica]
MPRTLVLVTGGSGFVAGHCILRLLEHGYTVRTTVRSRSREADVRAALEAAGMHRGDALSFVEADLTRDDGWGAAMRGADFVLHVASPVHTDAVADEHAIIGPAREGTLRVLRAATAAGVKRVVLTSAFHAVGYGHGHVDRVFTEDDWSPVDGPGVDAYGRSKILAERAAWDFVRDAGNGMELTTILPIAVMGPVLGRDVRGANQIIQRSLNGQLPGYPNMYVPIVDVRDVAAAHVAAMTAPDAAGQRFLVGSGEPAVAMKQIGATLRHHLCDAAKHVPTRTVPNVVVRLTALFKAEFKPVAADLGYVKRVSNEKSRRVLGLNPRKASEAILGAARSMLTDPAVHTGRSRRH